MLTVVEVYGLLCGGIATVVGGAMLWEWCERHCEEKRRALPGRKSAGLNPFRGRRARGAVNRRKDKT